MGGCAIQPHVTQPRALDEDGVPRRDLFAFELAAPGGGLPWGVGDVVALRLGGGGREDVMEELVRPVEGRFGKTEFVVAGPASRSALCRELATLLAQRLKEPSAFGATATACIKELRALGHDLWSFDESDDFQAWCPNYENPTGPGIVVTFRAPDEVSVEWSAQ